MGWPKWKKRRSRATCRFTTGSFGVVDRYHVRLPRIGVVKCHEATTELHRRLDAGTARS